VAKAKKRPFNVGDFLGKVDGGRTLQTFRKNQRVFAQSAPADAVFCVRHVGARQGGGGRTARQG
jgi:CRP/FNR family transcriptional regulator, cyclic AMP receptor protein